MIVRIKPRITIVVPAVQVLEVPALVVSFVKSSVRDLVDLRFVYLFNSKSNFSTSSLHGTVDGVSVTKVFSDRYFGTCEENIYRYQDFIPDEDGFVLCVGEHDEVAWTDLAQAINYMVDSRCEVLAINIACLEKWNDGSSSSLPALARIRNTGSVESVHKKLWNGEVLDSRIAFPALLSVYGPIDWAAYLGSHIYSMRTFRGVLQFRFVEHVYSLVYMQAEYFSRSNIRYALYKNCVISRISDNFQKMIDGKHSWGWLSDHRTVAGKSPLFWLANLSSLNQISNRNLASTVMLSTTLSVGMERHGVLSYRRGSFLLAGLNWISVLIGSSKSTKSIYLGSNHGSMYYSDLRCSADYIENLVQWIFNINIFNGNHLFFELGENILYNLNNILLNNGELRSCLESLISDLSSLKELCSAIDLLGAANAGFDQYASTVT